MMTTIYRFFSMIIFSGLQRFFSRKDHYISVKGIVQQICLSSPWSRNDIERKMIIGNCCCSIHYKYHFQLAKIYASK